MIYAVLNNGIVEKVVQAEPSTPFNIIFKDKQIIEVGPTTGIPMLGYRFKNGSFIKENA